MKIYKHVVKRWVFVFLCMLTTNTLFSQGKLIELRGLVKDAGDFEVPFASVFLENSRAGTTTTEDGEFSLIVKEADLQDVLTVSSLGFETYKIKVQDYLKLSEKKIILKDAVVALDAVRILTPKEYVLKALDRLEETTVSDTHMLKMLYRRASSEDGKARFFMEQYLKVLDQGPSASTLRAIEVVESRKSADYRFVKKKEFRHSVIPMTVRNSLRHLSSRNVKKAKWENVGNSSYEGEDVVIVEGGIYDEHTNKVKLYIGMDTYGVYRVDNTSNNSVYIYTKNKEGKLYLSYHTRAWESKHTIDEHLRKLLKKKPGEHQVSTTYKHEVFVMGIETDRKKRRVNNQQEAHTKDMSLLKIPYHADFWSDFKAPPETKYFKQIKKELASHFGVPLEQQFNLVNR
ncbi:carboxypeptidase-like regulatory domain-containing protein [Ochrovirga pacifica]|uniref:carboxypeptidase-like regulatory domain-containing protein n=1 Tax=Ochrovirga pacifica TaxID=1042376 RepID=UPI000A0123EF|nr:carboxypeptidase-like regulatory domain-containing protein [Ochrovirga pacifica]